MQASSTALICFALLPLAVVAQPAANDVWTGTWQSRVVRNDGSHISITLELEVTNAGQLRGRISGGVSGTVEGRAAGTTADGRWSVAGRGGSFALRLTAREEMTGDWNGEGGGKVSGRRALAAKPEDCPSFLMEFVLEDFRDPIGRECQGPGIPDRAWGFNGDQHDRLERFLRRNPDLIGHKPEASAVGASCLARLAQNGRLGEIPEAKRAERMAAITAEYYWSMKRLQDAVRSSFESLAALDKLRGLRCEAAGAGFRRSSGENVLSDIRCAEYGSAPGVARICDAYRSKCGGAADYQEVLASTEQALSQAALLRAELSTSNLSAQQKRALEQMIEVTESTSPWLKGAHFKARYQEAFERCQASPSAGPAFCEAQKQRFVCEGIRAEAEENRKLVKAQLEQFNRAIQCLEGVGTDCDSRSFRETLARAPTFVGAAEPEWMHDGALEGTRALEAVDTLYANSQFEQAECRQRLRQISNNINDEIKGFAINASLTVATFGMGAAVGAARLSSSAATAVRGANVTTKVSQLGQRANAFARHGPRMLELAALGLEGAEMARSVADAVRQCGDAFNQLGAIPPPNASVPVCPQGGDYEGARIISDYRDCVINAIAMEALLGGLPLAPAGVSKLTERRTLSRATAALGTAPNLPKAKADAVLAVFQKRFRKMSEEDLEASVLTLKKAGFSDEEIRTLLDDLMPDVRRLGGSLVHGLEGTVLAHEKAGRHTVSVARAGDSFKLVTCTSCGELDKVFRDQLARNPELRGELNALKSELNSWSGQGPVPRRLMLKLKQLTSQLELRKQRDFLDAHGIHTANNVLPARELRGVLDAYTRGDLTERQFNLIAEQADEIVWKLQRHYDRYPGLRGQTGFDPMNVEAVREGVVALRAKLADLHSADGGDLQATRDALSKRMLAALKSGELFLGGDPAKLRHKDLSFPRTTPELRAHARSKGAYRDPFGHGEKAFGLGDAIEADHVYPIAKILKNETFQSLPEHLKRHVIHNPDNILPLPAALNQSKGDSLADAWDRALRRERGEGLDPAYRNWLRERQEELKEKLEAQILCLAAGKPPATCK